jgi:hypothetical protein
MLINAGEAGLAVDLESRSICLLQLGYFLRTDAKILLYLHGNVGNGLAIK